MSLLPLENDLALLKAVRLTILGTSGSSDIAAHLRTQIAAIETAIMTYSVPNGMGLPPKPRK